MTHPDEEVVRRGYEAFSRGDIDTLRGLFTKDVVWHVPGRSPLAGDYEGVDAVLAYFAQSMERSSGTLQVEVHDVVANDNHTVGLHVARGKRDGKEWTDSQVLVCHLRDGKIASIWQHYMDAYGTDAFWA